MQKRAPVSESVNRQHCTQTRYVSVCFMALWLCSRSTVQHTCSDVSHMQITYTHTRSMSYALWALRVRGAPVGVISVGSEVVYIVICVWCHCPPLLRLVHSNICCRLSHDFITVSYAHVHTFTYTCILSYIQTFVTPDETFLQTSAPPCPRPAVASHGFYSTHWFMLVCSYMLWCNLSLLLTSGVQSDLCVFVSPVHVFKKEIYVRI